MLCLVLARRWRFFGRFSSARPRPLSLSLKVFASASQAQAHSQQNNEAASHEPSTSLSDSRFGRRSQLEVAASDSSLARPSTLDLDCGLSDALRPHSTRAMPMQMQAKCHALAGCWLLELLRPIASDRVRLRPIASDSVRFGPIRPDSKMDLYTRPIGRISSTQPARCFR